jgi:2-dehydropantoate 2-reductase
MRIAVVGSGGVGGYFGGLLARTGHPVSFLARGAHLQAIRARGLRVESLQGDFVVAAHATDNPAEIGPVDTVLLCVKTYDLAEALARMPALLGPDTLVLTLQNGVEAPELVAEAIGRERVLAGVVYCEVAVSAPGVISQGSPLQRIIFGPLDGRASAPGEALAAALSAAGVDTTLSDQALAAIWTKCCFICAMSGVTTLARRPLGELLRDGEALELLRAVMEEARAVALAKGIRFAADPVEAGLATAARFPPGAKSSMLRDLEAGRRLEIEALNGAIVRQGRAAGVPTPANQAIYAALRFFQPTQPL